MRRLCKIKSHISNALCFLKENTTKPRKDAFGKEEIKKAHISCLTIDGSFIAVNLIYLSVNSRENYVLTSSNT